MAFEKNDTISSRYQLITKVGRGGYSEVWLAEDLFMDKMPVALKIFAPDKGLDESGLNLFKKEYSMMMGLNHPSLLKASYFDVHIDSPFLVLPYCEKGSLGSMLRNDQTFDERHIARIIQDLAPALGYLHDNGIIHQDVKPDNILLNSEDKYMLSDFGISRKMRHTLQHSSKLNSGSLTLAYAAPERFTNGKDQIPASDIFSFGVMIYEVSTGIVPWNGAGGSIVFDESLIPTLPEVYSLTLSNLLKLCLSHAPEKRPSPEFLLKSAKSFLEDGRWLLPVIPSSKAKKRVTQKIEIQPNQSLSSHEADPRKTERVLAGGGQPSTKSRDWLKPALWISMVIILFLAGYLIKSRLEGIEDRATQESSRLAGSEQMNEIVKELSTDEGALEITESPNSEEKAPEEKSISDKPRVRATKVLPELKVEALDNVIIANQVGDYLGEILNGKPHGKGKMEWRNGDRYDGFFKGGELSGAGTLTYQNGSRYIGSFSNGLPNGQGILTLKSGFISSCPGAIKYNGGWKNGLKHGTGSCMDPSGNVTFRGSFREGEIVK